ncbi:MAG: T9SS type A sorting domain-containing protein [Bacteroidia bacterium]
MKSYFFIALQIIIFSLPAFSQNCNLIGNGNIETPIVPSSPGYYTSVQMGGWQTTSPDGQMELWNSGFLGVSSYSGVQHMEINGYYDSTLFQNLIVSPGTNLAISFAHRGRGGVDTLKLSVGPVGGPYTILGYFGDGDVSWGYYTVNYIVPNLGSNYSIRFTPVFAALNIQGFGNFIDSVTVCATNVGVSEIENGSSVSVSPNPFTDKINITSMDNNSSKIILYDLTARKLFEQSFINSISLITAEFSKGIYFYSIENKNGRIKKGKLIKQ